MLRGIFQLISRAVAVLVRASAQKVSLQLLTMAQPFVLARAAKEACETVYGLFPSSTLLA